MITIEELKESRRMGENSYKDPVNSVGGLFDLLNSIDITGKNVCEIGCWLGISTQAILTKNVNKLYAVDIWGMDPNYGDANWANLSISDVEKRFRETMAEYNNVEIIKDFSVNAAKLVEDNTLHFVYIDANHSYNDVMNDIAAWLPKLVDNGYIGGHDTWSTDIVKAIQDSIYTLPRLQNKQYEVFSDTSWLIKL